MKLFIDSADFEEIKLVFESGVLDGVTTNPSLLKKAVEKMHKSGNKISLEDYIKKILKLMKGKPVSLEVIGTNYEDMVREGLLLYKKFNPVAKNVYIKIPVNPSIDGKNNDDGIKAIKTLSDKGIPINCTLVFTPEQALLAAKAGASFVSPFAGRIDDLIRQNSRIKFEKADYFPAGGMEKKGKSLEDNGIYSGIDLVAKIKSIFENYGLKTEVLASSIRNPRQFREAAIVGADIATVSYSTIKELLVHEKTVEGVKKFTKDVVPEYRNLLK